MDMKLENVILPVTDVDRAKAFYEQAGFRLDVDHEVSEEFRVVQLTPPGSECSITIGKGITSSPPGTHQGLHLVVTDIEAAAGGPRGQGDRGQRALPLRAARARRPVSIRNAVTTARSPPSTTLTATGGCCRR